MVKNMFNNVRGALFRCINILILLPLLGCGHYGYEKNIANTEKMAIANNKKTHCSQINIFFENEKIEDLFFNNLLKKSIVDKIEASNGKKNNDIGTVDANVNLNCILSINTQKSYADSIISSDGSVTGKNVRIYVNYVLGENTNTLKSGNFFIFYNINMSKYQYSNKVLFEKEDKRNIDKISRKIFWDIKKFFSN
jgi:hypothetical protein